MSELTRVIKKLKKEIIKLQANQMPVVEPEPTKLIQSSGCFISIPKTPLELIKDIKRRVKLMETEVIELKDRIIHSD